MLKKIIYTESELSKVSEYIINTSDTKVVLLKGDLGAGKTTLVKNLVNCLGSHDIVSSPSYGLVNTYYSSTGEIIAFHFDFYRINSEMEALDFGFEEYLSSKHWIFIEWPEVIMNLLPAIVTEILFKKLDLKTREVSISNRHIR